MGINGDFRNKSMSLEMFVLFEKATSTACILQVRESRSCRFNAATANYESSRCAKNVSQLLLFFISSRNYIVLHFVFSLY